MATALTTGNLSLDVKYPFLSFAQAFFAQHAVYTWTSDPRTTKIIIADKYATDIGIAFQRPTITVSRGALRWSDLIRNQEVPSTSAFYPSGSEDMRGPLGSHNKEANATMTNIVSGSVRYAILFKDGVPAESAASDLYYALAAYKNEFKKKNVFKIHSMSMSEERLVRVKSDKQLTEVDIDLGFEMQIALRKGERQSNCSVYIDGVLVHEGITYRVTTNGTQIQFNAAPALGAVITITYVDANTLEVHTAVALGTGDAVVTVFTIPDAGAVYGYYSWLEQIALFGPGLTTLTLTDNYPDGGSETLSGLWANID